MGNALIPYRFYNYNARESDLAATHGASQPALLARLLFSLQQYDSEQ